MADTQTVTYRAVEAREDDAPKVYDSRKTEDGARTVAEKAGADLGKTLVVQAKTADEAREAAQSQLEAENGDAETAEVPEESQEPWFLVGLDSNGEAWTHPAHSEGEESPDEAEAVLEDVRSELHEEASEDNDGIAQMLVVQASSLEAARTIAEALKSPEDGQRVALAKPSGSETRTRATVPGVRGTAARMAPVESPTETYFVAPGGQRLIHAQEDCRYVAGRGLPTLEDHDRQAVAKVMIGVPLTASDGKQTRHGMFCMFCAGRALTPEEAAHVETDPAQDKKGWQWEASEKAARLALGLPVDGSGDDEAIEALTPEPPEPAEAAPEGDAEGEGQEDTDEGESQEEVTVES